MKRRSPNLCCSVNPVALCKKCGDGMCMVHGGKEEFEYGSVGKVPLLKSSSECRNCVEAWAIPSIKKALAKRGEFSHNIISNALRAIARASNHDVANALVDRFGLTKAFGIGKYITERTKKQK